MFPGRGTPGTLSRLGGPAPELPESVPSEQNAQAHRLRYTGSRTGDATAMSISLSPAPGQIFVSYRHDDTAYPCGWLFDKLAQHFGQDQVFRDIASIDPGDDVTG